MTDYYDRAVAYFTEHPDEIGDAWISCCYSKFGELFAICTPSRQYEPGCGCPVMIREALTLGRFLPPKMAKELHRDKRLPTDGSLITPAHLPVFAEWQRRVDEALGREPPK